ncbi:hypothetical protein DEJ23_15035 [Curtobacterium sp. MCSS17_008]|uniref:PH domain-containing protein n=1 Tax=Curtobacterium sp. MCSS17_008 TaxID=2175647 RepID=UPI000DAA87B9|nr:PH domain-containing protein [Curtobacterium sp. MCSS17_008]PZF53124.1 hypothetical protein DEJ23_15035 [Curtobacterium sp. MCSS17_008]
MVLAAVGPLAVLFWALWVLTHRPSIQLDDDALTVVNPLRVTRVPWGEVADVRLRWQIVVETSEGRKVQCWGGPSLPRPKPARRGEPRTLPQPPEMTVLLDRWASRHDAGAAGGAVHRGWDRPALLVGAGAVALLAVSLFGAALFGAALH